MSASKEKLSLWKKMGKSNNHIMKCRSLHFYTLSIFFLLPIFFTLIIFPSFHLPFFHYLYNFITFTHISFPTCKIILFLAYTLFLSLFFICGVAVITYSAAQAFYDKPITLFSSIKSITNSFFPLLSTFIVSVTTFVSIALFLASVFVFVVQILQSVGFIDSKIKYVYGLIVVVVPVLIWIQLNWSLAYVVAVVESKWGYETLRRSAGLVKGKRWVVFTTMMIYWVVMGMLVISCSMFLLLDDAGKGNRWKRLGVITQTVECSLLGFVMMLQYLIGNVALYMHCKELNGEKSPLKIGDKFVSPDSGEYVSIKLEDEKNQVIV